VRFSSVARGPDGDAARGRKQGSSGRAARAGSNENANLASDRGQSGPIWYCSRSIAVMRQGFCRACPPWFSAPDPVTRKTMPRSMASGRTAAGLTDTAAAALQAYRTEPTQGPIYLKAPLR